MSHTVTLIPGDGIGPSVTGAARRVLDATGVELRWDVHDVGIPAIEQSGEPLPRTAVDSIRTNGVALKGPVSTPVGRRGFASVNVALRRELDLFAQVRPCVSRPGPHHPSPDVDLVVIRDTTEDLYAGVELEAESHGALALIDAVVPHARSPIPRDAGLSIKYISPGASRRVATFAFDYARQHDRKRVTAVHKASVMRCTDGLFLEAVAEVAARNPEIDFDDCMIDNLCGRLVRRAPEYSVLLMPNMYGDIVSDIGAGLIGGVGLAPGANYGPGVAVFEPTHGSAPRRAGTDRANPTATILCGAMLLEYVGEHAAARCVTAAVDSVLAEGRVTYDLLGGQDEVAAAGTEELADQVIGRLS
jgi:isocitrate dehydrogenase (NAD+)